jgi:hypothetical protein
MPTNKVLQQQKPFRLPEKQIPFAVNKDNPTKDEQKNPSLIINSRAHINNGVK